MKHCSKEVKIEAVRMFLEEGMTRREIKAALGKWSKLPGAGRLRSTKSLLQSSLS